MNKNITLIAIILAICTSFASCINVTNTVKRGCGNIVTSERTVSAFQEINISSNATVRFHASDEFRVVITTDENLHEYIEIETRGNTLYIGNRGRSDSSSRRNVGLSVGGDVIIGHSVTISNGIRFTQLAIDVFAPTLSGVTVSGLGRFETVETLSVPSFTAIVSGSGRITSAIESDRFSATVSGSGRITAVGSSRDANVSIAGSGRFIGSEFVTNTTTANVTGSGNAAIHVTERMNASVAGSGRITYRGNPPQANRNVSGSGSVRRAD